MLLLRCVKGITVLELMIVVAIVAILAALALPSLLNFSREHKVRGKAQELYYFMQNARSEAVKRNQTVYVNFQTGDDWCYGMNAGSNCACNIANNCGLGTVKAPQTQSINLTATGLTNGSVSFEAVRGGAAASSLITFTAYGLTTAMGVKVTTLGTLTLCSSTISGYAACT